MRPVAGAIPGAHAGTAAVQAGTGTGAGTAAGTGTGAGTTAGTGTAAGSGTATGKPKPEQNTPGDVAIDGPAMAALGMVPQPNGGIPVPSTLEPQTGPKPPHGAARADDGRPQPDTRPLSPKPGPKKFAIEGADARSKMPMLKAVTNAFLAISMNPPL